MKTPVIEKLHLPDLIENASKLAACGYLHISKNNLLYLDIDDQYIHQLFPFLQIPAVNKPNYFGISKAGAHVSVIYPEENITIDAHDLYAQHEFNIQGICSAELGLKKYYVLMVESPTLLQIRKKYGLSDLLPFKGYWIGFHITIGKHKLV